MKSAIGAALPGAPACNGLPERSRYIRGARRPTWMLNALAHAEAEHGPPVPTCLCGAILDWKGAYGVCGACGWDSRDRRGGA